MVSFTPDQLRATQIDRHLAVEAGAGAGKTSVLVQRYLSILSSDPKLSPRHILTITFTRKSAGELMERIHRAIHSLHPDTFEEKVRHQLWKLRLDSAQIGTIHSFCTQILRRSGHLIGIDPQFKLIEDWESRRIWKDVASTWLQRHFRAQDHDIVRLLQTKSFDTVLKSVTTLFTQWEKLDDPTALNLGPLSDADIAHAELSCFVDVLADYRAFLLATQKMDFSHLQFYTAQLLEQFPEIADQLAIDYPFIMIDEFQDTDPIQWKIISLISNFYHTPRCNIFVVGDIKQAIYGFRGSDTSLFQEVLTQFETRSDAEVVQLRANFRSTDPLIQFYNQLFSSLFTPTNTVPVHYTPLESNRWAAAHSLSMVTASTRNDEYQATVEWIQNRIEAGTSPGNIAIICRKNAPLAILEKMLTSLQIPSILMSNHRPLRSADCQTLLIILRYLNDPTNTRNALEMSLIPWSLNEIHHLQSEAGHSGIRLAIDRWVSSRNSSELQSAWDLINELLDGCPTLSEGIRLIEKEMIVSKGKTKDQSIVEQVKLMTIHSSKGLEFEAVAVVGCGDRLFTASSAPVVVGPNQSISFAAATSADSEEWRSSTTAQIKQLSIEEEKRTFYVACTRAKDHLLLAGKFDPAKKPPETPNCFFDFLTTESAAMCQTYHPKGIPLAPLPDVPRPAPVSDLGNTVAQSATKLPIPVSVSQLIRWMDCVRQYELSAVLSGFSPPRDPANDPTSIGILVHRCIEQLLHHPDQDLTQLATQTGKDLGLVQAVPQALAHLQSTQRASGFSQLIARTPIPEYGFQVQINPRTSDHTRPLLITGRIDCISQTDSGVWMITDFKTESAPDPSRINPHHRTQLMIYAIALAHAKGVSGDIETQLFYTQTGQSSIMTCSAQERQSLIDRIIQLPGQLFTAPDHRVCEQCPVYQALPRCRERN